MMDLNYGNYLQLFASLYHVHPSSVDEELFSTTVNKLTAARREYIEISKKSDLITKKEIAHEIIDKYSLNDIPNIFDVDFTEYGDTIGSTIQGSLKNPNLDSRVVEEAKDFSINVLNGDLQSFNSFVEYLNNLDKIDSSTITEDDEKRHDLITNGINGSARFDRYLLYGSSFENSRTSNEALYDVSWVLDNSSDKVDRSLPEVKKYFDDLLDIRDYINKSSNPEISQEELDSKYEEITNNHEEQERSISEYNEMFFPNKAVTELFSNSRKEQMPEILLKHLSYVAYNDFDNVYGFGLREQHRAYANDKDSKDKNNHYLLVYVDQFGSKYLDESAIIALLGEDPKSEYIDSNGNTFVSSRSHIIEKGIPDGMKFNRNLKSSSLQDFEYDEELGLYKVTDQQLDYLIHCYEARIPDVKIVIDYKDVVKTNKELNDMLNYADDMARSDELDNNYIK